MSYRTVDLVLFLVANLVNLLIVAIMLSRPLGRKDLERRLGLVVIACALPVGLAVVLNAVGKREWWAVVLPLPLLLHFVVELLLDYVLRFEFRKTRWLGPYLLIFYAGQMGMIGYSFLAFDRWGFVTLGTYFLSLAATGYSYSRVGHG